MIAAGWGAYNGHWLTVMNSKNEGMDRKDKRTMDITQSHTKVSEIFQYIEKPHNK